MRNVLLVFLLLIFCETEFKRSCVFSFPSSTIPGESQTKSHNLLNIYGIYQSTNEFLIEHNLVNDMGTVTDTINEFFGIDRDSQTHFLQNIHELTVHQSLIQRDFAEISHYHVNGEQIITAHNYVRSLRQSLIGLAGQTGADVDILRQRVAECLYTLQQFYSNTNWVELNGDNILKEFGISSSLSVPVSGLSEEPCSDCPTDSASLKKDLCMNNTRTSQLTSGYKSGQDVSKPPSNNQGLGKCSHGSQDDESRLKSATGGIYKGRSSSVHAPHHFLHDKAFEAAKKATIYFLADKDEGIFSKLGFDLTREVFKIKSNKESKEVKDFSITFVIDVTGSMGDNIAGVIQGTTRFVTEIKQSEQVPEKYILVTFSDPVSLETSKQTSDPDVMTGWLNDLTVSGGDDCPEYSLSGLITGGRLSNKHSTVYIYTDAPPKDYEKENDAISILQSKNLTAKFRLRNECESGRRRRRDTVDARLPVRSKRQSNVYDRIAAATGGDVQRFATASELADKVEEDLMNDLSIIQNSTQTVNQNELPSSMAMIKWSIINPNSENVTIEVDETVEAVQLEINGTFSSSNILLRNPNGALMTHGSDNITVQDTGILTTISIQSPARGVWRLENVGNSHVKLNITATSPFDVSSVLSEMSTNGIFYPVNDNPIYGKEYGIVVSLENLPANASVSSILLVAENGTSVASLNASLLSDGPRLEYFAKTAITTQISGVQLHGIDPSGFPFIRSSRHIINPVDVALKMKPYIGDLPLSRQEYLHFNITNFGVKNKTVTVTVSDDKGYVVDNGPFIVHLSAGETTEKTFYIQGTQPLSIVTVVIELKENETQLVLQTLTTKLVVSSATRPFYNVTSSGDTCRSIERNGSKCDEGIWTGSAQIGFSGGSLTSVYLSTSTVNKTHQRLDTASPPLNILLRGDCCTQSLVLTAIDQDGYIARCPFVLYTEDTPRLIKDSSETADQERTFTTLGGVIGGVLAVIVIAAVVVTLRVCKNANAKVNSNNTHTKNGVEDYKDKFSGIPNDNVIAGAPPQSFVRS